MRRLLTIIAALLLVSSQLGVPIPCRGETVAVGPSAPFNAELYSLGYDVFLANGNPRDAYLLAEKAVQALPEDLQWRQRAARSGEWSGNTLQALEHWSYLAGLPGQQDASDNALRLARELGHHVRMKELLEKRGLGGDFQLALEYMAVCEALGEPEDAIRQLAKHRNGQQRQKALEELARLYGSVGRPREAVDAMLDKMSDYGITAPELLTAASLTYGSGDIQRAYAVLSLGRQAIPATARDYWQNMSDLAWSMQDMPAAEQAARLLVDGGKGREEDYQRLILLVRDRSPDEAYRLSLAGWNKFGIVDYLKGAMELGISLNRHKMVAELLAEQEKSGRLKPQEQDAYYWNLVSQVQRGIGEVAESVRSYREALKRAPADGELAAGYVWLLLDLDRRQELRDLLRSWQGREKNMPSLYDPLGAAHAYLGQYRQAVSFFQHRYLQKRNDPGWLAAYADALEQTGWQEAAFLERMRALYLARTRMKAGNDEDRQALIRDYARVAMLVRPGDEVDTLMRGMMAGRQDDAGRELVAAWALASQRSDLARLWFWREYARMARRPRWVELALALEDNDRPKIARLLQYDLERLPYRDAIEGAVRVGSLPLAESIAFDRFQTYDRDYLLDNQLRDLYGSRKGGFRYHLALLDQGGVGFLEQMLSVTGAITPRYAVKLEAGNTDIRHQKNDVVGLYPASAQTARMGLLMRHEKGSAEIFGGFSDALYTHPLGGLLGDWRLDHRLTLELALLTGAEASESAGLKIGGMKDEARLVLRQGLTSRDTAVMTVSGRVLRDQQWNRLGDGVSLEGELDHRLLFAAPDTTLRLFSGYHHYSRDGILSDRMRRLVPSLQRPTAGASYFVPESFAQVGAGILVGQEGRDSYIRDWRPFGAADVSWTSTGGTGFHYELGFVGPVLGLDKLEGAFSQDSGSFGNSDINSRFDLRYRYYFR